MEAAEKPVFLRVDQLERNLAALQSQVRHLEDTLACRDAAVGDADEEIRRLKGVVAARSAMIADRTNRVIGLQEEVERLTGEVKRLTSLAASQAARLGELQDDADEANRAYALVRDDRDRLTRSLSDVQAIICQSMGGNPNINITDQ